MNSKPNENVCRLFDIRNLRNYNQQKTCLAHIVIIDETLINLYRPLKKDQAKQ